MSSKKKKNPNSGGGGGNSSMDERFKCIQKDPRFWEMPEREQKIKIDKRFQSMFHDDRFKVKYTVDKRGRPINQTSTDDLRRFYKLSESEEDEEEEEKSDKIKKDKKKKIMADSGEKREKESDDEGGQMFSNHYSCLYEIMRVSTESDQNTLFILLKLSLNPCNDLCFTKLAAKISRAKMDCTKV